MAETARRPPVTNKALADQLLPGAAPAAKAGSKAADEPGSADAAAVGPSRGARMRAWVARQPSRGVLVFLLGISLIMNGIVVVRSRGAVQDTSLARGASEVELGSFVYRSSNPAPVTLQEAQFSLALSLLDGVDRATRDSLERHPRRVRQAVEELLRTANNDDFDDPTLAGLKRRLQEQINGVLGVRGISEVIITDLVTTTPLSRGTTRDAMADAAGRSSTADP